MGMHEMPRKRFKTEEIIQKLREAEVLLSQGKNVAEACRQIGVTDQTYYRWRKEYGGVRTDQAKAALKLTTSKSWRATPRMSLRH